MAVHQLIPSFVPGDATGQAALHLQWMLRRLGHAGGLYAAEVGRGLEGLAQPIQALHPQASDWVLYHHGIASGLSARLMHLPCRRGVVFHNISPGRFYEGTPLHSALAQARAQLSAMAPAVELGIGVSDYNTAELAQAGYTRARTVPLIIEPERFALSAADPALLAQLKQPGPTVLSVSRVAPHKRFEDLLALHAELLRLRPQAQLLLVGGFEAGSRHFKNLRRIARSLRGVHFLGRLSHTQLVAAYRAADVFVSMSEHEGFGVPLLEAMASELPVLAYGAAAVPETLGGAGISFDEKRFAFLAELTRELAEHRALRQHVLRGQAQRLNHFSPRVVEKRLASVLAERSPAAPPRPPRRKAVRPRVGIVVQRFGEVSGGAERHARQVAERMSSLWDVTVLTSCAADHLSWKNVFEPGLHTEQGLKVWRFPARRQRQMRSFNALSRQRFEKPLERLLEEQWVAEQGPACEGLLSHLETHRKNYDGFLFFTYLYAPTVWGLPMVGRRALLVPTAHDEPPLRMGLYRDVFERPHALMCNTPEEIELIARHFPHHARARVVGVGIDAPEGEAQRFAKRHRVDRPYLFYVGRIEAGKGIGALLDFHRQLRARFHDAPDLILAGESQLPLQAEEGVRYLGRIDERDKHDALAGALAVVIPSRFESLSLLALEAFAQGTPVLVNGHSEVLVGQVKRSGAGQAFTDAASYSEALREVGLHRATLSVQAKRFAAKHRWERVVEMYREEMEQILKEPHP